ncbi:MAG: hypothetical protein IPK83_17405 [Planctomycetes bacterium]|nr:hypothetical protein [Planctomycetota bacterium]
MAANVINGMVRIAIAIAIGFPMTTAISWQLFLILFSPPSPENGDNVASLHDEIDSLDCLLLDSASGTDDAGCDCDPDEMDFLEFRVQTDNVNFIGHAYIKTPDIAVGFFTEATDQGLVDYLWPFSKTFQGYLRNDFDYAYDYVKLFRACPKTIRHLERAIAVHTKDRYQVGSWGNGRNCATWAADRLREAGLTPPPGDCPNKMAWSMKRVASSDAVERQMIRAGRQGDR